MQLFEQNKFLSSVALEVKAYAWHSFIYTLKTSVVSE